MSLRIAKFNYGIDTKNKYYKDQLDTAQDKLDSCLTLK